ncbi:hypothetical protein K3M67_02960 [Sphingobium sp. V4]|uniref:hypothetical protein n=1 Tax=Sphingobium sp. V4 TaxID=3038927 RepID=UPI0025580C07|nr:hypothetical protein [Sphingobium sp. V4]WIW88956.1 hypothetical protein K3M67_02960 [Sphingobium sp. V4]
MASIMLPTDPGPNGMELNYVEFGGVLTPALGGAAQRINRPGDRHAVVFSMPPLVLEPHGRIWINRLRLGVQLGAVAEFLQPDFHIGSPGAPVIDGDGQAGKVLSLRGFTPYYQAREGQAFSIIIGGRRYLHFSDETKRAGPDGKITVSVSPMLRASPANGDVCEFGSPKIEGILSDDAKRWTTNINRHVGISFTVTEAR